MARELSSTIQAMFSSGDEREYTWWSRRFLQNHETDKVKYMEIPIKDCQFEMPLFALTTFTDKVNSREIEGKDAIVASLNTLGKTPRYKTLDRSMRDSLNERFSTSRLVRTTVGQGDNRINYYVTHGAVFDENFTPIMLASWIVEKERKADGDYEYSFIKPVLHINPEVFLYRDNQMEKFIGNRIINASLEDSVPYPENYLLSERYFKMHSRSDRVSVKVDIDELPFSVYEVNVPSVSITNKELLQIVLDHLDDCPI